MNDSTKTSNSTVTPPAAAAPEPTRLQKLRRPIMIGGVAIIVGVAAWFYFTAGATNPLKMRM
ncbi:MAG: hypothetical protein WDO56_37485 [Gammaproteobacteria bacterium]